MSFYDLCSLLIFLVVKEKAIQPKEVCRILLTRYLNVRFLATRLCTCLCDYLGIISYDVFCIAAELKWLIVRDVSIVVPMATL